MHGILNSRWSTSVFWVPGCQHCSTTHASPLVRLSRLIQCGIDQCLPIYTAVGLPHLSEFISSISLFILILLPPQQPWCFYWDCLLASSLYPLSSGSPPLLESRYPSKLTSQDLGAIPKLNASILVVHHQLLVTLPPEGASLSSLPLSPPALWVCPRELFSAWSWGSLLDIHIFLTFSGFSRLPEWLSQVASKAPYPWLCPHHRFAFPGGVPIHSGFPSQFSLDEIPCHLPNPCSFWPQGSTTPWWPRGSHPLALVILCGCVLGQRCDCLSPVW